MRVELTIKTNYLPEWGCFEGIRELIQNAKDGEMEFQAPLKVRHRDPDKLVIENEGCTLPHEALLFGHTTKVGRGDLIGKFGEGLKLGVLALVRAGYPVKIRSGAEVWIPSIERSEKFDADVLVFNIAQGRQPKNRIQVEVSNITKEEWELMQSCFLFLNKKDPNRINTSYGAVLLGKEQMGKIYVKGIFVENDPDFHYGYDLTSDVAIDRDRKMVNRWDLKNRTANILVEASRTHEFIPALLALLEQDAKELSELDSYMAHQLPEELKQEAVKQFSALHGGDAVPVDTLADSKDVEHLGKKGVVVNSKPLKAVLQAVLGNTYEIKEKLANEVMGAFGWADLATAEQGNLEGAISLVNEVQSVTLEEVDVVDFRSPNTMGMFKDGRILVAKNILVDRDATLETVVHEVAHRNGCDGSLGHVATIERIWSKIVAYLRDKR